MNIVYEGMDSGMDVAKQGQAYSFLLGLYVRLPTPTLIEKCNNNQ